VLFADCDGTLSPEESGSLLGPLRRGEADLVLGTRVQVERGALPCHQRVGNRLVCLMLRTLHGVRVRDLSPFRAVRWELIERLALRETTYGHGVELIIAANRAQARMVEREVSYRKRVTGRSKVAGSPLAALRAGALMLLLCLRLGLARGRKA
jgi:hypothetical protein